MNKRVNAHFLPRQARPVKRMSSGPGQHLFNTIVASAYKDCLSRCEESEIDSDTCEYICKGFNESRFWT